MVVSLLEPEQEAQLVLEREGTAATASGVEFRPFPVPDRDVPASRESVAELTSGIIETLETVRNVAVHCRQGIGRSALIAGGVLVAAGEDPDTAFETIEQSRGLQQSDVSEARAQRVSVTGDTFIIDLVDGRTVSVPLAWYPRLMHGNAAERAHWRFIGEGEGIHRPDLDEDVSIEGILAGRPSGETQARLQRWLDERKSG